MQTLADRLQGAGLNWQAALLQQAAQVLELGPIAVNFGGASKPASFLGAKREPWRDALAAIAALSEPQAGAAARSAGTELVWQLTLDGQERGAEPRAAGARGRHPRRRQVQAGAAEPAEEERRRHDA